MKILHILNDGASGLSEQVIRIQSEEHEIKIINLQDKDTSYASLIDQIFSSDQVISW